MKFAGFFAGVGLVATLLVGSGPRELSGQNVARVNLTPDSSTSTIYRVVSRLDGRGVVSPAQEKSIRLQLDARFQYDERVIARKQLHKSIREYETARAEIRLGDGSIINQLPEDRRIIIAQTHDTNRPVKLAAIGGLLTQKEFELINVPANTLILGDFVAHSGVSEGDAWEPPADQLARFLNIDAIEQSDVQLKLENLERGIARLFVGGNVTGQVDDAQTEITVSGTIHFDTRAGFMRGCELTINQRRDISRLAPGLDATFKMLVRMAPVSDSPRLTNEGLAELRQQAGTISDDFLLMTPDRSIELVHSRDWRVITQPRDRSILRLIENGRMLGQCDIIPLPSRPTDKPQTLEQFREVVAAKLADQNATITEANQSTTKQGLEWMRVTASGATDGVRLIWTYYTISHPDGQRVQLVFTSEPELSGSFSQHFDSMIGNLSFREPAVTQNASFEK